MQVQGDLLPDRRAREGCDPVGGCCWPALGSSLS